MRLELILPRVKPDEFKRYLVCPHEGCEGRHFEHHQEVDKPLKDTGYEVVSAHRFRCLRCNRTFRVYPVGVTRAQTSQRVKVSWPNIRIRSLSEQSPKRVADCRWPLVERMRVFGLDTYTWRRRCLFKITKSGSGWAVP